MLAYKLKGYNIQIEDLVENGEYDKRYPTNLFRGSVYYRGTSWKVFHSTTLIEAKEAAKFWVDTFVECDYFTEV